MIKISVELRSGATRFKVCVQAQSIERALQIVESQHPAEHCRVIFPIDAETFFEGEGRVGGIEAARMVAA